MGTISVRWSYPSKYDRQMEIKEGETLASIVGRQIGHISRDDKVRVELNGKEASLITAVKVGDKIHIFTS